MKTITLFLISFSVLGAAQPDCVQQYHYTNRANDVGRQGQQLLTAIPGVSSAYDNINNGCNSWIMAYDNEGLSALSIQLESAPNANNTPGTFAAFAGAAVFGSNPSTATTSATYIATGYYPYLRINVTSFTGTGSINVSLYGYKTPGMLGYLYGNTPIMFSGRCTGAATSSSTLSMDFLGSSSATLGCVNGLTAGYGTVMPAAGTVTAMYVQAVLGGVNSSSGVFTAQLNDMAQSMTCTTGTATTCNTTANNFNFAAGDRIGVKFTTQGSESLFGIRVSFRALLK